MDGTKSDEAPRTCRNCGMAEIYMEDDPRRKYLGMKDSRYEAFYCHYHHTGGGDFYLDNVTTCTNFQGRREKKWKQVQWETGI